GVLTAKVVETRGKLVGAMTVDPEEDEVFAITSAGGVIRTGVDEIKQSGRTTMGVRLMNLEKGNQIVAVARNAEAAESEVHDSDAVAAETADQDLKSVDVEGSGEEDGAASGTGSDSAEAGEKAVTEPKPSVTEGPPAVKATMSSRKAHLTVSRVEPWSVMKF